MDALVEWAATSLLKLPRILYYGVKGLVTHNTHYLSNSCVVEVLQGCLCCLCLEFALTENLVFLSVQSAKIVTLVLVVFTEHT
jgi:hypothetical protein